MTLIGLFNLCVAVFCFIVTLIHVKEEHYGLAFLTATFCCMNIFCALLTSSLIR